MMDNNILLDSPKEKDINNFLNYIYDLKKSNSDLVLDKDLVYKELCRYGIKDSDMEPDRALKNYNYLFGRWFDYFYPIKNVSAFCDPKWSYFFQFVNGEFRSSEQFIKLYIPIDGKHLEESVNRLFKYIASLGVEHCSKVSQEIRSDNVIVRLRKDDYYNAMKIINFINSDEYIKNGLNKTNPFVPTVNGIGIMEENGISYNGEIAALIASYINTSYKEKRESVNYEDFNYYVETHSYNRDVQNAMHGKVGTDKESLSSSQKLNLFLDALTATYQKYGLGQAIGALKSAMNGNFSGFTNSTPDKKQYRNLMIQNLDQNDIKVFVRSAIEQAFGKYDSQLSVEVMAPKFCNFMFQDDLIRKLDSACKVTIANYDTRQLSYAIQKYLFNGSDTSFSQFKVVDGEKDTRINYRTEIDKIGQGNIMEAIKRSLMLRGVNVTSLSDKFLIEMYSHELEKGMNYDNEEVSNSHVK